MKLKNVFAISDFNSCGGVESFAYYMAKLYGDSHDLTFLYHTADAAQIERLKKLTRVIKYNGQKIECELLIVNYDISFLETIKAKKTVHVIHADFKRQGITPIISEKIDEYLAVSKVAAASWTELTGKPCRVLENPLSIEEPRKVLRLISATRLTPEKGRDRMEKLAAIFQDANVPFLWTVFTDAINPFKNSPNFVIMKPRLDITDFIADADYLVQLSDSEACCYSVIEALSLGTPVITTDLPTFKEQGVKNGANGYLLPLDMKGIDAEKIYNCIPQFEYKRKPCQWPKILAPGASTYKEELRRTYIVEANENYQCYNITDKELGRIPKPGEHFIITGQRLEILTGDNPQGLVLVKVIKEAPQKGAKK